MAYYEVTVIVDGYIEEERIMFGQGAIRRYADEIEQKAAKDGIPTQIYVMHHDHPFADSDCACAQYVQDHHPQYSFNMPGDTTDDTTDDRI